LPELWIPYGAVEALVTVQAENLGAVVDLQPERAAVEAERLAERVKGAASLFVCDASPTTSELLKELSAAILAAPQLKVYSAAPRRVETAVPELKGRIATLPPPVPAAEGGAFMAPELTEGGTKLFIATPRPDPLFGMVDARVAACLNWVARSRAEAARARKEMEPTPFEMTRSKEVADALARGITGARFLDIIPRGGKVRAVMEDAPFDALRNAFAESAVQPAKAVVVGAGGRGYDDTLSSAIRTAWYALGGARKAGTVLLMAECSEGLGSTALEMAATGRTLGDGRRRDAYVDGAEDVLYLSKLREEYDVLLLSGLPEVYAKSKLGLTTARGAGEAVVRLLSKLGKTGKMNVVTRANECRLVPA
jgi:hypothetical protein